MDIKFNETKYNEYKKYVDNKALELLTKKYPLYDIQIIPLEIVDSEERDFDVNIHVKSNDYDNEISNIIVDLSDPIDLAHAINSVVKERINLLDTLIERGINLDRLSGWITSNYLNFPSSIGDINIQLRKLIKEGMDAYVEIQEP